MKTVLVTSGCGFIGSQFLRLLVRKSQWRIVNLDNLTYAGNSDNVQDVQEGSHYRLSKAISMTPAWWAPFSERSSRRWL
jgi:dTDP-glucose 4,6-dehydratase